jgi:hypothetical protein
MGLGEWSMPSSNRLLEGEELRLCGWAAEVLADRAVAAQYAVAWHEDR